MVRIQSAAVNCGGEVSGGGFVTTTETYDGSSWSAITTDTDVKTNVSANDTTAGYLNGKLVAGEAVTFTENSDGGNETLTIDGTGASNGFAIAMSVAL